MCISWNTFRIYSAFLNTLNILDFVVYIKSLEAVRKFYRILIMLYHILQDSDNAVSHSTGF